MEGPINTPPRRATFLGAPVEVDPTRVEADFAFLGIPYGVPYEMEDLAPPAATAAVAVRQVCEDQGLREEIDQLGFDFDLGRPLFEGGPVRIVDCGDVPGDPRNLEANEGRATQAVRGILAGGAVPLVVGGDHSIPPFVVAAYESRGPIDLLQIDAHLDGREERLGVRGGYSSPMFRLRQMPWVRFIAQVGLRGTGFSRRVEVDQAVAAGNLIVPAYELHERGVDWIVERFEEGGSYYITLDIDGLDPATAPGTPAIAPGGVTYPQRIRLLRGLAARGEVVGIDVCEFYPSLDVNDLTALTIARLFTMVIGLATGPVSTL
jgi:agmatinase